jgi:hypothetical protein
LTESGVPADWFVDFLPFVHFTVPLFYWVLSTGKLIDRITRSPLPHVSTTSACVFNCISTGTYVFYSTGVAGFPEFESWAPPQQAL